MRALKPLITQGELPRKKPAASSKPTDVAPDPILDATVADVATCMPEMNPLNLYPLQADAEIARQPKGNFINSSSLDCHVDSLRELLQITKMAKQANVTPNFICADMAQCKIAEDCNKMLEKIPLSALIQASKNVASFK